MNTKQNPPADATANGVRYDAYQVDDADDNENEKSYWTRIGVAFPHRDGKGLNVVLKSLPIDGKIVLRLHQRKPTE